MPSTYHPDSISPFCGPEVGDHIRFSDASFGLVKKSNAGWYIEDTDRYGDWTGERNGRVGSHPYLAEFAEALRAEDRRRQREVRAFTDDDFLDEITEDAPGTTHTALRTARSDGAPQAA